MNTIELQSIVFIFAGGAMFLTTHLGHHPIKSVIAGHVCDASTQIGAIFNYHGRIKVMRMKIFIPVLACLFLWASKSHAEFNVEAVTLVSACDQHNKVESGIRLRSFDDAFAAGYCEALVKSALAWKASECLYVPGYSPSGLAKALRVAERNMRARGEWPIVPPLRLMEEAIKLSPTVESPAGSGRFCIATPAFVNFDR